VLVCAIQRLRDAGDRVRREDNLKQLGFALRSLPDQRKAMPPLRGSGNPSSADVFGPTLPDEFSKEKERLAALRAAVEQDAKGEPEKSVLLPAGWKLQISTEGGFTVGLPPGAVVINEKQTFKALGERGIRGVAGFTDNKCVFAAYSFELPEDLKKQSDTGQLEALGKAFRLELGGATPKREAKVTIGKLSGFEIEAGDKQANGIVRIFVAGQRVYVLMAGGPKLSGSSEEAQGFFGSFKLNSK
jgi:hypothetical protein